MKITVDLSQEEMDEIKKCRSNHIHRIADLEINIIDAIDGVLELPSYDVEIVISDED